MRGAQEAVFGDGTLHLCDPTGSAGIQTHNEPDQYIHSCLEYAMPSH